jgi:hypothetical protein
LLQQEQQFQSEQASISAEATRQQENARAGFEFLQSAGDLDSLERYYDSYYEGLNEDQKKAFDLVYQEKQRELGFISEPTTPEITRAQTSFNLSSGSNAVYRERNEVASFVGNLVDSAQDLTSQASKDNAANLNNAFKDSENWGANRNGTVYKISSATGDFYYGFYDGRWYEITGGNAPRTVTRTFNIK